MSLPSSGRYPPGPCPPGLSLSTAGTISGVPTGSGSFTFAVDVSGQGQAPSAPVNYTLIVGNVQLTAIPGGLPDGRGRKPIRDQYPGDRWVGPLPLAGSGRQPPAGLTLDTATGAISGAPLRPGSLGSFTVQISDSSSLDPQSIDVQESILVSTGPLQLARSCARRRHGRHGLCGVVVGYRWSGALFMDRNGRIPSIGSHSRCQRRRDRNPPHRRSLDISGDSGRRLITCRCYHLRERDSDDRPRRTLAPSSIVPPEGVAGQRILP